LTESCPALIWPAIQRTRPGLSTKKGARDSENGACLKGGYLRKGEKRGNYGLFIAMDIKILMTEVQRSLNLKPANIMYIILYINI